MIALNDKAEAGGAGAGGVGFGDFATNVVELLKMLDFVWLSF